MVRIGRKYVAEFMNERATYRAGIAVLTAAAFATVNACAGEEHLSPLALAIDRSGKTLFVAEAAARQVAVVDIASGKVTRTVRIPAEPGGLALSGDESVLYVTAGSAQGMVHAVSVSRGKVSDSIAAGHTPVSPVLSPDGKTLYVCNRFNNDVSVIDLASKKEKTRIRVSREPVASVVTPDGKLLFVANLLPAGPASGDYAAAEVSVVETASGRTAAIPLPNGSSCARGICVSPDGRFVYVVHNLSRYQLPTTQLERGWMNTSAMTVIDAAAKKIVNTVLVDDVDLGAANPWGVACADGGKWICVTHAGTHELSVIDRAALHEKLDRVGRGEKVSEVSLVPDDVPNDLSFLVGLRRRIPLAGNGPRGLAVAGARVCAAEYFTDTIAVADVGPEEMIRPRTIPLGEKGRMSVARRGEMLFNDATICFQRWQSCASCHPDGRTDGLNWDLLNDGIGNPKQTKSLLLSHKTPPAMATSVRETAEMAVRSGLKFILFVVRPEEDAVAIDEYLKSLQPVPGPRLANGKLSPSARRGGKIFGKAGCVQCHPAPLYTDMETYDVGTGDANEKGASFDSPTLVEIWRTAPFLYDGRAAAMEEVFTRFNTQDKHGTTSSLSPEEIKDLTEFVLSQ